MHAFNPPLLVVLVLVEDCTLELKSLALYGKITRQRFLAAVDFVVNVTLLNLTSAFL